MNHAASYETMVSGGPEARSATRNVIGDTGSDLPAMAVSINRPMVLASHAMGIDYPAPDPLPTRPVAVTDPISLRSSRRTHLLVLCKMLLTQLERGFGTASMSL